VITVVIAMIFRSLRLGLVSLIPNVLPLVIPLGVLGLFGLPLDGPAVIVVSVALGICVDDTIHFFSSFVRQRRSGATTEEALRRTFRGVGGALTATTVVLVAGFAVLGLSDFRPNLMIGQLAVVMIALAWVADFIVTPAFITLVIKKQTAKQTLALPERREAVAEA
jgi:predicted RND superfamily exporter protein